MRTFALIACVSAFCLAACGEDSEKNATNTTTPTTATAPTAAGEHGGRRSDVTRADQAPDQASARRKRRRASRGAPLRSGEAPERGSGAAPSVSPPTAPVRAGAPTIVIKGTKENEIYGPYDFEKKRYVIRYERSKSGSSDSGSIPPLFTVTLDRRSGVFDETSLTAIQTQDFEGTVPGLPVPGGKFYVRVASNYGSRSYSISFAPER